MARWLVVWGLGMLLLQPAQAVDSPDWLALERAVLSHPAPTVLRLRAWQQRLPASAEANREIVLALLGSAQLRLGDEAGLEQSLATLKHGSVLGQSLGACLQGERLHVQGRAEEAEVWLKQALARWPAGVFKGQVPQLRCIEWLARVKTERHQFIEAADLYRHAVADSRALPPWRQSLLLSGWAQTLLSVGQWEQAQRLNTEAAALLERMPDALAQSEVLRVEALLRGVVPGQVDGAASLQAQEEAVGQARLADVVAQEARTLAELAAMYVERGEGVRAQQLALQARDLAEREQAPYLVDLAQGYLGLAQVLSRRVDEGLRVTHGVLERLHQSGRLTPMLGLLRLQAVVLEHVKEPGAALKTYRAAQSLAAEMALSEQQAQLLAWQTELDSAQIEHERHSLEDRRQLNAQAMSGRQLQTRVWGGGLALLVVLLPLMWRWYARSRAAQRALAVITTQLQRQSQTDVLTGLPNRRYWHQHVACQPMASGGVCLIDLDFFKQINDRHGHAVGDEVLVSVARRLQALLPPPHTVVRWGGEEFLIRVAEADPQRMRALVGQMLAGLSEKPVMTQAGPLRVTGSLGWAVFPLAPQRLEVPWDMALAWVDALMYQAKQQGRHRAWGLWHCQATALSVVGGHVGRLGRTAQPEVARDVQWVEQLGPGASR